MRLVPPPPKLLAPPPMGNLRSGLCFVAVFSQHILVRNLFLQFMVRELCLNTF